jgi:two-component system sensor histidine kinase KdpD
MRQPFFIRLPDNGATQLNDTRANMKNEYGFMWRAHLAKLWQSAVSAVPGGLAVVLLTFLAYRARLPFVIASPLYLLIVVLQSLTGDFLAAAAISVLVVACLDFFFIQPLLSFGIDSRADAIALLAFLATALVITKLVAKVRAEATAAMIQKDRLDRLYQLARQLLALEPEEATGEKLLEPFRRIFGVTAVCVFDASTGEGHLVGESRRQLADQTRDAYILGRDTDDAGGQVSVRRLQSGSLVTGAIGFEGLHDGAESGGPLAALTAVLLERIRSFQSATAASAATQVEAYRSAILDALAHEFKTPLATILTAAGGIREAGPLTSDQAEMAETVETEASRLGRLTSRLLRVAQLDREEVKPRIEMVDVASLAGRVAEGYSRMFPDRQLKMQRIGGGVEAPADPELLRLALSQLVENACRYSPPGAEVRVSIEARGNAVAVSISNTGSAIPARESRLIFERFYRGAGAKRHTAGSGLGLYVARKIALAHGGSLSLENGEGAGNSVTFRLEIPGSQEESAHVAAS